MATNPLLHDLANTILWCTNPAACHLIITPTMVRSGRTTGVTVYHALQCISTMFSDVFPRFPKFTHVLFFLPCWTTTLIVWHSAVQSWRKKIGVAHFVQHPGWLNVHGLNMQSIRSPFGGRQPLNKLVR